MRSPVFKWRDAAEKEWTFRQLYALGYQRIVNEDVDDAWADLSHESALDHMRTEGKNIKFTNQEGMIYSSRYPMIKCNSGAHMIDYIKTHKSR